MKMYLLLRNNVESGPYSVDCLKQMRLEKFDLIWIKDESITWKYPSELQELRQYAPKAELTYASLVNSAKEKQIRYFREYNINLDYKKMNISYINEPDAFTSDIPEGYEYLVAADNANRYGGSMSVSAGSDFNTPKEAGNAPEIINYNLIGEKQKLDTAEIIADHQQFTTVISVKIKKKDQSPGSGFTIRK